MTLPDPPVDPLLPALPWDLSPLAQFNPHSSIEQDYQLELPLDLSQMSQLLDTINLDQMGGEIDPEDGILLEADSLESPLASPAVPNATASRRPVRTEVSWLRRTEYISAEQKGGQSMRGAGLLLPAKDYYREPLQRPRDVIEAVERGFKVEGWKHPTRDLSLESSLIVMPMDTSRTEVIFDADPQIPFESRLQLEQQEMASLYVGQEHLRDYDLVRTERPAHYYVIEVDEDEKARLLPIDIQLHLRKRRASKRT